MASRSNDVSLVIKARNDATKELDKLNKSLDDVAGSQDKVSRSADKTGSLLDNLGSEVKELGGQLNALGVLGKIAGEFDRASKAVSRIDGDVKEAANSFADLARKSQAASDNTTSLRARLESETRSRDQNNAALREAKKELAAVDAAIRRATTAQERANAAVAKQTKPNPFSAASSAGVFAEADLVAARSAQERLTRDIAGYEGAVKSAKTAIKDLQPAIVASARQQEVLANETDRAARALRTQREDLAVARNSLAGIRDISEQATVRLGALAETQGKVSDASAKMAAQMAAAKARIDALSSAAKPAVAGTAPSVGAIDSGSETAMAAQRRALLETRREWVAAQEAVKRLAQEMRAADGPTEELGAAFGRAQAQARLAKQSYDAQAAAMQRSAGAAQGGFVAYAALESRMRATSTAASDLAGNTGGIVGFLQRLRETAGLASRSMDGVATGTDRAKESLNALGGERQALSLMQRLRAEVLSLVSAYVGLYAAANQIGGVISAFQTIEAAQSRLGVVFNQDTGRVAKELAWLRSEAQRLGITFSTLSDEYGKFAVAASTANFTAANTRKIFTSVSEAARVNKLSVEQTSGVFLALTQMISKGKISAEELTRQLGDRLAGAFDLMAKAMGVTTAELSEMMQKGELLASESNLLKFATEMDKKFGPQLSASLVSVTAEIGRFQNELFNAQVRVGEGGFMDGLRIALMELNKWFESREGRDFFLSLGAALGSFMQVLAQVPPYFGTITTVIKILIALKLASIIRGISFEFTAATAATATFGARLAGLRASMVSAIATLTTLSGALAGIRTLAVGVLGALGGIPGLIVTGVVYGLTTWLTGIDKATSALDEHKRQLDAIVAGYDEAGKGVKDWASSVKGLSFLQAQTDLDNMKKSLDDLRKSAKYKTGLEAFSIVDDSNGSFSAIQKAVDAFRAGTMSAADFKKEVDRINATDPTFARDLALGLQKIADEAMEAEKRVAESEAKLRVLNKTATEADYVLLKLKGALDEANRGFDPAFAKQYTDALKELKGFIPELATEMKRLQDLSKLDTEWRKILDHGPPTKEAQDLYNRAVEAINLEAFSKEVKGSLMQATVGLLKTYEGFTGTAKWDVNAYRAGYGSDTVTLDDGSIQKITQGMTVTQTDALRDLVRRIGEFQDVVKKQVGGERFNAFTTEQQAALTSIAYNYGSLPERIMESVRKGSAEEIAAAVRSLKGDNNGVNSNRRESEAQIFERGSSGLTAQRAKAEADVNQYVKDRVETLKEETTARQESTRELAIQREINKAEKQADKDGVKLSQEQLELLRQSAGARFDALHATEAEKAKRDEVKQAIAEVVGLDQQRVNLMKELLLAQQQGDGDRIANAKQQITDLNAKIVELLPNAMAMAKTLGDEKMIATLGKVSLNTDVLNEKVRTAASNVNLLGLNFGQMKQLGQGFVNGFANMFDKFAQAISTGTDKVTALREAFLQFASDFLRQIAQMILKQAMLNMMKSMFPAGGGNILSGIFNHTGGLAGKQGSGRRVDASVFAGPVLRYHNGGIAGLKPNEVPTVLEKNEEVLTTSDPRHQFNGGGAQKAGDVKIVNAFDGGSFLSEALNSRVGEKVLMNFVKANAGAFKSALG